MPFRAPTPGVLLDGKYRLAERIGGGGMGDVFRAENILAGRAVAIKFLHPEFAQSQDLAQRFFREAQAVNRIRHPNIVDVIDAAQSEMGPYIVMEYLEGESVGAALSRVGRFDSETAIACVIPVLEALDAAHRAGIVHRDLKPENVFIAIDPMHEMTPPPVPRASMPLRLPVVRLLDFGIAKVLDQDGPSPRTRTGVVFGTPDYLSPEQATGEVPLDGRSDLFAVGVLLYEIVTGVRPFRAPTAVATAFRVVHADAPAISAAGVVVDSRLEAVVGRLLQKDPAKRYPTAGDVSRELERIAPDANRRRDALLRLLHGSRRFASEPKRLSEPTVPTAPPSISTRDSGFDIKARVTPSESLSARDAVSVPRPSPSRPGSSPSIRSEQAAAAATARSISIRPFPDRFAGRYQVRGPVLRSIDRGLSDLFGRGARDEVVSQMPDAYVEDFRNDSINAMVAYDLEALDAYMEIASGLAVHDVSKWRELGRHAVDGELLGVVRPLLRPTADLSSVIRRGVGIWARLFTFGAWRVAPAPEKAPQPTAAKTKNSVGLHIAELDAVSLPLRLWIVGVVEHTARRALGCEVRASITLGELSFVPELACEIAETPQEGLRAR